VVYIVKMYGWQSSFWISAAIGLVIGSVWYLMARDVPRGHPWISAEETTTIEAGLPVAARAAAPPVRWSQILGSRSVMAMSLAYFTYGYVAYIYFTWFFIYLNKVRGVDLKSSAILGALPGIAMATCSPLGGWISDRLSRRFGARVGRCILASAAMGASAVFVAFGPLAADAITAVLLLAGGAGALYLSQSSFWSVSADISGPSAGVVSGFMNMANQIGGAITASLTPVLADRFGWATAFLITASICGAGALAWLLVDPSKPLTAGAEAEARAR
jgi:ACS family glucarate transporter-like MFS transporter